MYLCQRCLISNNYDGIVIECMQKRWGFPSGKRDQLSTQLQQLIRRMLEPDIMMRNTVTQILASDWLARR